MREESEYKCDAAEMEELSRLRLTVEQGGELDVNKVLMEVVENGHLEVAQFLVEDCNADVNLKVDEGGTALMMAACEGHLDVVRFLVEECNADINAKNDGGLTALMMAIGEGRLDVVRYLAKECDSDANAKANIDFMTLMCAVFSGHLDVVRFLAIDCGADVNVNNKYAGTALMLAAEEGHLDVVRFLVKNCDANVDVKANNGDTALMRAVERGSFDVVLFLIKDCGADVNVKDNSGATPLMRAAGGARLDVVRFLIKDCGAGVNVKDSKGATTLIRAAGGGHLDVVRSLIEDSDAEVDVKDSKGATSLMRAVIGGHHDVVFFLVKDCGAGVNVKDNNGDTALTKAAGGGDHDVVRFLIKDGGANVNVKDSKGATPLMRAAEGGHLDIVRFLIKDCCADVNVKDDNGGTALMRAARGGYLNVVGFLFKDCGAVVTVRNNDGDTALMRAAEGGHLDVVRFLIKDGDAVVTVKNNDGDTALMRAAGGGHLDVVRFLIKDGDADVNVNDNNEETALMRAARGGYLDIVLFLIKDCAAGVNVKDSKGATALMRAAGGGFLDVVRFLIKDCGADSNVKDDDGDSALMRATGRGYLDVVQFLGKECNADVHVKDNNGGTTLLRAARGGYLDVVEFLIKDCGVGVNAKDDNGDTALTTAAGGGDLDVVRFLIKDSGAVVTAKNNDGDTALMRAAGEGRLDVVRFLIRDAGADVNVKDNNGDTALITAAGGGHVGVVRFLIKDCGANVNVKDSNGDTALMRAAGGGHLDIVRFLIIDGDADVNTKNNDGVSAIRIAADHGHTDIVGGLAPFVLPQRQMLTSDTWKDLSRNVSTAESLSSYIPPTEVEVGEFYEQGNFGGNFQAKWLDADAVAKLFIPDASHGTLEQEVCLWQQLRHPNVLKLYGICQAGPSVNLFVCEYASLGSLAEYAGKFNSFWHEKPPLMWKYLYEAALGLEYLHERGIVHGDLRCRNILVGSDGLAKLSNFGLAGFTRKSSSVSNVVWSMRWQAPEVLEGNAPSRESDVYSLGMCILEAESGEIPWCRDNPARASEKKMKWNANTQERASNRTNDPNSPELDFYFFDSEHPSFVQSSRELVWQMCRRDPHERPSLASIACKLESLAVEESLGSSQPQLEPTFAFDEYLSGEMTDLWHKLRTCMNESDMVQYHQLFNKLKRVCDCLQRSEQSERLLRQWYSLLTDAYRTIKMTPEETRLLRLTSTSVTTTSLYSFSWRVDALLTSLGESVSEEKVASWQQQRREEAAAFVSGISDTVLLLQLVRSVEEKAAFLQSLKAEMESPDDKYTAEQRNMMKRIYDEIEGKLGADGDVQKLTPEWFIPWYELIVDKGNHLGTGGFGSVCRGRWLDSEVVVKEVLLPGSAQVSIWADSYDSLLLSSTDEAPSDPEVADKRAKARVMFRHEADIWFRLSHPHVVRLFGACHIGRPFFVCAYAAHGTLDSYLRKHPDELWTKLREAALGVQYLHARGVVHGDLKGNNIVVGSDMKAKVTDFGLSSSSESEGSSPISGAWHWVAPECLIDRDGEQAAPRPTFESDVVSTMGTSCQFSSEVSC
ncbi:unnamed protein product [Phytophthora fragariaefolia]|uniref:Unnamed protein product n=1 Tax=Phytophthora fragariaefolia TaxID=1490495 RepID=A0A9W6Y9P7_9STRA|nr:unnamed protein product [Phytophthora fragariaefolia]